MNKELAHSTRNSGMDSLFGWDPFSAVFSRNPVEKFFGGGFPFAGLSNVLESDFSARIVENEDSKQFKYALPGISKDNIKVEIIDNVLSVQVQDKSENGERAYYSKVTLDQNLDLENVTADSKDGLLVISIPIKEPTPRRIPVTIGEDHEALESGTLPVSQNAEQDDSDSSKVASRDKENDSSSNTG